MNERIVRMKRMNGRRIKESFDTYSAAAEKLAKSKSISYENAMHGIKDAVETGRDFPMNSGKYWDIYRDGGVFYTRIVDDRILQENYENIDCAVESIIKSKYSKENNLTVQDVKSGIEMAINNGCEYPNGVYTWDYLLEPSTGGIL